MGINGIFHKTVKLGGPFWSWNLTVLPDYGWSDRRISIVYFFIFLTVLILRARLSGPLWTVLINFDLKSQFEQHCQIPTFGSNLTIPGAGLHKNPTHDDH